MITTTLTPHICPACRMSQRGVTGDGRPHGGDLVLCTGCHCWLVVVVVTSRQLTLRLLTDGEWIILPTSQRQHLTDLRDRVKAQTQTAVAQ